MNRKFERTTFIWYSFCVTFITVILLSLLHVVIILSNIQLVAYLDCVRMTHSILHVKMLLKG